MGAIVDLGYMVPNPLDATTLPPRARRRITSPYATGYCVPFRQAGEVSGITSKLLQLVSWTKWSPSVLAQVIGTTPAAIARALEGNDTPLSCSADQQQRLDSAFAVVSRIYLLADHLPERTAYALTTPGDAGVTATRRLVEGEPAKAYLVAMRVLRPAQPRGMMVGSHPLDVRRASVAVLDED